MVTSFSENPAYKTCIENEDSLKIYSDVASAKGGKNDGLRPHDLLCASFAACLNITIRMLLDKERLLYDTVKISVELNRDYPDKTIFVYSVDISGNIEEEIKQAIIKKASQCPVHRTLSKTIIFEEKHQS